MEEEEEGNGNEAIEEEEEFDLEGGNNESINSEDLFINNHSPIKMDISTSAEPPREEEEYERNFSRYSAPTFPKNLIDQNPFSKRKRRREYIKRKNKNKKRNKKFENSNELQPLILRPSPKIHRFFDEKGNVRSDFQFFKNVGQIQMQKRVAKQPRRLGFDS